MYGEDKDHMGLAFRLRSLADAIEMDTAPVTEVSVMELSRAGEPVRGEIDVEFRLDEDMTHLVEPLPTDLD
jgi:hypothetical protein